MQETWVQSLGQKDLLEKEMETHFSILAWETPWTEEPDSYSPRGCKELVITQQLNKYHWHPIPTLHLHSVSLFLQVWLSPRSCSFILNTSAQASLPRNILPTPSLPQLRVLCSKLWQTQWAFPLTLNLPHPFFLGNYLLSAYLPY